MFRDPDGEVERGGRHFGRGDGGELILEDGALEEGLGQAVLQHVHVPGLGVAPQEVEGQRPAQPEVNAPQHPQLHGANLARPGHRTNKKQENFKNCKKLTCMNCP